MMVPQTIHRRCVMSMQQKIRESRSFISKMVVCQMREMQDLRLQVVHISVMWTVMTGLSPLCTRKCIRHVWNIMLRLQYAVMLRCIKTMWYKVERVK